MPEPVTGPDHTHVSDSSPPPVAAVLGWLRTMSSAIDRACKVLDLLCVLGACGVVLIVVGLLKLGVDGIWLFAPVLAGVLASVPVYLCWYGCSAVDRLRLLPHQLGAPDNAASVGEGVEEVTVVFSGRSLRSLPKTFTLLRSILSEALPVKPRFAQVQPSRPQLRVGALIGSVLSPVVFALGLVVFLVSLGV